MHEGTLEATLLEGHEDLEVVGESYRQANLLRVVGGRHRPEGHVRMDVYAMLLAEDGNPHDPNAVSIWIDGLMVGYLPRDQARTLRPGLLAVQEREGKPVALEGVIVGGGMRDDGPGRLGVVLRYDPEDFGLAAPPEAKDADARPRAALPVTTFSDPFVVQVGCGPAHSVQSRSRKGARWSGSWAGAAALLGHAQSSGDSATLSACHFRKSWSGWISRA